MSHILLVLWSWLLSAPAHALGDDVLLYTGNSGFSYLSYYPMTTFETVVTDEGCAASVTEDKSGFPTDLSSYRVVFLLLNTAAFTTTEIATMSSFMAGGGVLVLVGDQTGYGYATNFNNLLSGLGATSRFSTSAAHDAYCEKYATVATTHALNTGASNPVYAWSGAITTGTGATAIYKGVSGQTIAAVEGNLILAADLNLFIEDCALNSASEAFFLNIYAYAGGRDTCDLDNDGVDDEACGGLDCDDCNSASTGSGSTYYADSDGDGYGNAASSTTECSIPTGYVSNSSDCNDSSAAIKPGATEIAGDGIDQNCDGKEVCYTDADGDSYRTTSTVTSSDSDCSDAGEALSSMTSGDCNDSSAAIHPGVTEITGDGVDQNCDNLELCYVDVDNDGYRLTSTIPSSDTDCSDSGEALSSEPATDCDDTSSSINPGATEITGDGLDQNCDGKEVCYTDADGDSYRTTSTVTSSDSDCSDSGEALSSMTSGDCNDSSAAINPSAAEIAGDGVDQNCDSKETCYVDADNDGYRLTSTVASTDTDCSDSGEALSSEPATDCNDTNSSINPSAAEVCDGVDNDCDSTVDESSAADADTWYRDADGDGYGTSGTTTQACSAPSGYLADDTDCDDTDSSINPSAAEVCDGDDNDCDSVVDESSATDADTWYRDADEDGYGDAESTTQACSVPSGYLADDSDCDDSDDSIYPGAEETSLDGIDSDCDGEDDVDEDGDGYASSDSGGTDCDDGDADVYPGAAEVADGIDQDCDGTVDEGTDYADEDGDGYAPAGGDCDDDDASVHPGAAEEADGIDQDCDGTIDEGTEAYDDDGDGYSEADGDCDDSNAAVGPGEPEVSGNGIDDDCDGVVDSGLFDEDGDGYLPEGGDCDDTDGTIHPGALEEADGIDQDCDGTTDEGTEVYDDDGDGYSEADGDCDDSNAAMSPDAEEVLDGVDNNCDLRVDEGTEVYDDDGDGYSEVDGDCDDSDAARVPGADEVADGVDNDCDGLVDEVADPSDQDGDGYAADGDCDDTNGWVYPGAEEVCDGLDNDCNGTVDDDNICGLITEEPETGGSKGCMTAGGAASGLWLVGLLGALRRRRLGLLVGASTALGSAACTPNVENGLTLREPILEGDTLADLGDVAVGTQHALTLSLASVGTTAVVLEDIVLEGDEAGVFAVVEDWPAELAEDATGEVTIRYTPTSAGWHSTQVRVLSDSIDGTVAIEVRAHAVEPWVGLWPPRLDFGPVAAGTSRTLEVMLTNDGPLSFNIEEVAVPEPFSATLEPTTLAPGDVHTIRVTFSPDDTAAQQATLELALADLPVLSVRLLGNDCTGGDPALYDLDGDGFTPCGGDCDDADAAVRPGAAEVADGIDQDCDGTTDEGTEVYDDDGDGYSEADGDCDDSNAAMSPGAAEAEDNGMDDDCDGVVDDGRPDQDGDGFAVDGGDCDDTEGTVHPGALEEADGIDQDCDGTTDEGTEVYDDDGDGYSEVDGDCDDTQVTSAPGAAEAADWVDNDCDGAVDEGTDHADDDGDGFSELGGDCDDGDARISPAAREVIGDGVDNDCDGGAS